MKPNNPSCGVVRHSFILQRSCEEPLISVDEGADVGGVKTVPLPQQVLNLLKPGDILIEPPERGRAIFIQTGLEEYLNKGGPKTASEF
jgi:hypothetical protein